MARKILFLVSAMSEGGAERVAANLADAWAARGSDVTLVITFSGRGACHYRLSEKVRLLYLADEAKVRGRGALAYFRRFRALRNLVRREDPDVVVSFLTNVNVAALACCVGLKYPLVVSERIYPPAYAVGTVMHLLRRLLYPTASKVVLQTSECLDWLRAEIPRAHGVVIPNSVSYPVPSADPQSMPETLVPAERRLLLGVGRLHVQKGFDALLNAFAELAGQYPDWDLIVLGEGPERVALQQQVERMGLTGRALLPGHVGNMGDWYNRADLYVMSSRFEGFPNSLVEAMAHGCAVVSYDCDTGPRDMIRHGDNGLLVAPVADAAALAAALDQLMADAELRQRFSLAAVDVRDRFSMARVLARWDSLFDQVSSGRRRTPR